MLNRKTKKQGFSKKHRLNSKKVIDRLFHQGRFKAGGFLRFRYLPQKHGFTRVVISISKRVGDAPERNRLKRLIREGLRLSGRLRDTSLDCAIFVTQPPRRKPVLPDIERYIHHFFSPLSDEID